MKGLYKVTGHSNRGNNRSHSIKRRNFIFHFKMETQSFRESKPSTEIDELWIYHDRMDRGKWMLFYDKDKLDDAWEKAKDLFDQDELVGISSMKVSTKKDNPRASSAHEGVIIFYCGPCSDTENMLAFGENVLDKMDYNIFSQDHHPFTLPFFTFKTEVQSAAGTRSLGQLKNHSLRLPFP